VDRRAVVEDQHGHAPLSGQIADLVAPAAATGPGRLAVLAGAPLVSAPQA